MNNRSEFSYLQPTHPQSHVNISSIIHDTDKITSHPTSLLKDKEKSLMEISYVAQ